MPKITQIITTIGPSSTKPSTLEFFKKNGVQIARMNLSHNTPESHLEAGTMAREHGLELLFDLPGPKIRLGEVSEVVYVKRGLEIVLEPQKEGVKYPYTSEFDDLEKLVFPSYFPVHKFVQTGHTILIDDGKLNWKVQKVVEDKVFCRVIFGGMVKSRKGMNMPDTNLVVDFLGERDKMFLNALLVEMKPEYVAASFVKTKQEILDLKKLLHSILDKANVSNYFPKIVAKIEMSSAVQTANLTEIIQECDMIMVARGDLALETNPAHIAVPFYQEKIKRECRKLNKPFIIATQVLETMTENPVPTRAEVSDLYRAVVIDEANFVMLSVESAMGSYPEKCVELMWDLIKNADELNKIVEA